MKQVRKARSKDNEERRRKTHDEEEIARKYIRCPASLVRFLAHFTHIANFFRRQSHYGHGVATCDASAVRFRWCGGKSKRA